MEYIPIPEQACLWAPLYQSLGKKLIDWENLEDTTIMPWHKQKFAAWQALSI